MRTLIYKRTHNGDPDPETGQFGIYDCMGRVRTWDFEAVIGVGGLSAKPKALAGKVNWVGIKPHVGRWHKRGPIVTFETFVFDPPGWPDFEKLAPLLAERIYSRNVRAIMTGLSTGEQEEVDRILVRAKRVRRLSFGTSPRTSVKGCSS